MFESFIGQTEPSLPPIETTLPSQANQVTKWISEPAGKLIAYRATDKTTSMFRIMNLFTGLDQSGKEIAKIQFHIRSPPATRKEQNLPPMIIRPGTHWEDVLEETQAVAAEEDEPLPTEPPSPVKEESSKIKPYLLPQL